MPTHSEGSSPNSEYIKSLENSYKAKFKSTNRTGVSYSKVRNQLEINVKLPSSAGAVQFDANGKIPDPWGNNSPHKRSVTYHLVFNKRQ